MKVAFFSNFLTHHQLPFCKEMQKNFGNEFHFVATESIAEEQLALGYPDLNRVYDFVVRTYEEEQQKQLALKLADEADVVILGSAPLSYIRRRLKESKLTFLYSERIYKKGYEAWKLPVRLVRFYRKFGRYKNLYLLCASAYTAADYAKTHTFIGKTYKWGYFPETKYYDHIDQMIKSKKPNSIMWAGRFIDWKHPDYILEVARRLKADGYDFSIKMIGCGVMEEQLRHKVKQMDMEDCVSLPGSMSPEEVRANMEESEIYLFTSDRNEGWGAVLNESMNSGCAVVASHMIGATPFLVEDGVNGLVYTSGDVEDLYKKVKTLLDEPCTRKTMGQRAYETMTQLWNAQTAAERVLKLSEALLNGDKHPDLFESGPCSKAPIVKG